MEITPELISKLMMKCLTNSAAVKLIMATFDGYVKAQGTINPTLLKDIFRDNFDAFMEEEIKLMDLDEQFYEYFSEEALKQCKQMLGL